VKGRGGARREKRDRAELPRLERYDTRLELIRVLVANPTVPLSYPDGFLYDAPVAAEVGEPGAMAALIDLKLSDHVRFGDKAGACALLTQAAQSGDAVAVGRAAECPR